MHASFVHCLVLCLTVCSTVTAPYHSTLPIHTVNPTLRLKSSNHFSFQTLNCFEQFCTAYNLVSRAEKGKYSKTQNIPDIFFLNGLVVQYFEPPPRFLLKFVTDVCYTQVEQNSKLRIESKRNLEIWKFQTICV